MSIKHWPEGERPREKLLERGAKILSDAELLAVLLRIGTQGMSAVDLARSLLQNYGGLRGVMHASQAQLSRHKGMGSAAYAQFAAVLEIGRRVLSEDLRQQAMWDSPDTLARYLRLQIGHETVEVSHVLFLNHGGQMISSEEVSRGTLHENAVYPREIIRRALMHNAAGIILAHNHPSGDCTPSAQDFELTRYLQKAARYIGLILVDHFIVSATEAVSFRQQGWLNDDSENGF